MAASLRELEERNRDVSASSFRRLISGMSHPLETSLQLLYFRVPAALIVSFESSLPFRSKDFEENVVQMTESLNYKRRRRYINLYTHSQRLRRSLRFISYLSRSWEKYTYLVLPLNFSIFIVSLSDFHS